MGLLLASLLGLAALQGNAGVRVLDVKGLNLGEAKGDVKTPLVIGSAEELAKAISDGAAAAKIKGQVDFAKEKLLFFNWSGSGGDKLSFTTAKGVKGLEVTLVYTGGLTRDYVPHYQLIVLPKDATWKVETGKMGKGG